MTSTRLDLMLQLDRVPDDGHIYVVGALITNGEGKIYAHRRSLDRKLFPGCWDVAGGHVEPGETLRAALEREVLEETGWRVVAVLACVKEFDWESEGTTRHEVDYLVQVDGDLTAPRLGAGKQDSFAWFGVLNASSLLDGRDRGDTAIYEMVTEALGIIAS